MMETRMGEEEDKEEETAFNHSRCNLGFQGLAQKTHPNRLQSSRPNRLEGWCGVGGPLWVTKLGPSKSQRPLHYAALQGSPFNNSPPA